MSLHHILREIAKVAIGLFIADIVCGIWLGSAGFFPLVLFGVTWTTSTIAPIALFDIAMILLLAHYGWKMKLPIESPTERGLFVVVGSVFLIVALLHLLRIAFGWNLILGDVAIPLWLSWLGVIVPAYLSYSSFHFAFHASR